MKTLRYSLVALLALLVLAGCGGDDDPPPPPYPYEDVYGATCRTYNVEPDCTFNRDGTRVTVYQDRDYNLYGRGSDDMLFVVFDATGYGTVYSVDTQGQSRFEYYADVDEFAGYIPGTVSTIGVGTSGTYWEEVANGTYWLGRYGVLYSANQGESTYLEAIN